jgi:hypothetical protein
VSKTPPHLTFACLERREIGQVGYGNQRYETNIRDITSHTCFLWTLWSVYYATLTTMNQLPWLLITNTWDFWWFSKIKLCLASSFDSLGSLNVYMSSPRHWTCLSFIILLMVAICGAQGRERKDKHTCIILIAKSKTRSKEKIKSHNKIRTCTCTNMRDMVRWILDPEWVLEITI